MEEETRGEPPAGDGPWLRLAHRIDRLNDRLGRLVGWLTLSMVLIGAYNALARYVDRWVHGVSLSSNTLIELQWYLFSAVFLLGAAYTLRKNAHVRVDVLYGRLGRRGRTWIDLVGTVIFLLPFSIAALLLSWPSVRNSWAVGEMSPDPGGLPRYPIKTVILVAFALLLLQGVAWLIKLARALRDGDGEEDVAKISREGHA